MTHASAISRHLRARKSEIGDVWQQLVRAELPELRRLDTSALLDHLPEVLEGLAHWIDGDTTTARSAFSILAEAHALQRLGYGIDLVTLTREYVLLRKTILRELMAVPSSEANRELLLRLDEGLDEAIHGAVRRYTNRRDDLHDAFVGKLMTEAIEIAVNGLPTVVRPADMGELWEEVIADARREHPNRALELKSSGMLVGVWDHDRVRQAMTTLVANVVRHGHDPIEASVRETDDHEAVITSVHYRGPEIPLAQLFTMREIVLSHAGYWDIETKDGATTITITWPRTPLEEVPQRA